MSHDGPAGAAEPEGKGGGLPDDVAALIRREAIVLDAAGAPVNRPPVEIQARLALFYRVRVTREQITRALSGGGQ